MEAAFVNFVRPGDPVVVGVNGVFGERMCDVADRLGIRPATLKTRLERGRKKLADALTKRGIDLSAVLLAVAATSLAPSFSPFLVESILTVCRQPPASVVALPQATMAAKGLSLKTRLLALTAVGASILGLASVLMPTAAPPPEAEPAATKKADPDADAAPKLPPGRLDRFGISHVAVASE